jgi:hypothetical protein
MSIYLNSDFDYNIYKLHEICDIDNVPKQYINYIILGHKHLYIYHGTLDEYLKSKKVYNRVYFLKIIDNDKYNSKYIYHIIKRKINDDLIIKKNNMFDIKYYSNLDIQVIHKEIQYLSIEVYDYAETIFNNNNYNKIIKLIDKEIENRKQNFINNNNIINDDINSIDDIIDRINTKIIFVSCQNT